jgi:hypothetical protein
VLSKLHPQNNLIIFLRLDNGAIAKPRPLGPGEFTRCGGIARLRGWVNPTGFTLSAFMKGACQMGEPAAEADAAQQQRF